MSFKSLLVEIRTEELPPAQVWALAATFPTLLQKSLTAAGFAGDDCRPRQDADGDLKLLATPRRFAALLDNVRTASADTPFLRRGPKIADCRDATGAPTKALLGFMQSVGVDDEESLSRVVEKEREYIAYQGVQAGKPLATELAAMVENVLRAVVAPRLMRWAAHDFKFVRPVRGLLMMHGKTAIVSGSVFGIAATKTTVGHPVLAAQTVALTADSYEETLAEKGAVIVDLRQRREAIVAQFDGVPITSLELLDEIAAMCEQPSVYEGAFDDDFLVLPSFCVEGCMIKHQRSFPMYDGDRLSPRYRFVADNKPTTPDAMIKGFNTVLRARLRDVAFYMQEDKKLSADDALQKLRAIIYHRKLGSQYERAVRLADITAAIAELLELPATVRADLRQAAMLCKCDLPTLMIGEYPEFEGRMAATYFCQDETAAAWVRCHNARDWRRQTATLTSPTAAYALLLANHLEKLVGMFGIGEKPSGSKDPHGLRTAAMTVAAVQQQTERRLPLTQLIETARAAFGELPQFVADDVWDFIVERKRQDLLSEKTATAGVLNAVLALRPQFILDIEEKSLALTDFLQRPESATLIEVNKRINNILRKSAVTATDSPIHAELLRETAEVALHEQLRQEEQRTAALARHDYTAVLNDTIALKPAVDAFFADVLVNTEDAAIRDNRFALLLSLRRMLNSVADLSELSG